MYVVLSGLGTASGNMEERSGCDSRVIRNSVSRYYVGVLALSTYWRCTHIRARVLYYVQPPSREVNGSKQIEVILGCV